CQGRSRPSGDAGDDSRLGSHRSYQIFLLGGGLVFQIHSAPEPGSRASMRDTAFPRYQRRSIRRKRDAATHDGVDPAAFFRTLGGRHSGVRSTRPKMRSSRFQRASELRQRRTAQIRTSPATADPMPTARRILSGVASALFMARRIQAGPAANIRPSSTNRIPTPMRKSANAMDLIGLKPPV